MKDWKIFLCLTLFVTVVLFFVSPDSYTHLLYNRVDSAIFYTSGKAWMNGLTPYIDFADSKGLLLWLIYGLGYLLSPLDYTGVFWISCAWYALTYWLVYKTSFLFLQDKRLSFICTICMTLAFFNSWYHYEVRSEDFCLLFVMLSLYSTSVVLYTDNVNSKRLKHHFFLLGVVEILLVMIKFNIAVMNGIFILYSLYHTYRQSGRSFIRQFLPLSIGAVVAVLPFLLYLISTNTFLHFIDEYFINTTKTVSYDNNYLRLFKSIIKFILTPDLIAMFIFTTLGCISFYNRLPRYRMFPFITFFVFVFIANYRAHIYYYTICAPFFVWSCMALCFRYKQRLSTGTAYILLLSVLSYTVLANWVSPKGDFRPNLFFCHNQERVDYENMTKIMQQVNSPTIIYLNTMDTGIGVPAGVMPGSRYWTLQNGATSEMRRQSEEDVRKGISDFVLLLSQQTSLTEDSLNTFGYTKVYEMSYLGADAALYSKHPVTLPTY